MVPMFNTIDAPVKTWTPFNVVSLDHFPHLYCHKALENELKLASSYYRRAEYAATQSSPPSDLDTLSQTSSNDSGAATKSISLYKTEMCASFATTGACPYTTKCKFAHGEHELRNIQRHPKYKSSLCRNFWETGICPYGNRCCFMHQTKHQI